MENVVNPGIEENGNVNISDEVVSIIASLAASEVHGVASMGNSISGGFAELLGKKNLSKGVKLTVTEKEVSLDLSIIVEYGTKIPDVAWKLQEKVKSEVEAMTGLTVTAVNVSVDGVNMPKPEAEEAPKETPGEADNVIEETEENLETEE
ncbi:MAG: Asp23/Gls24 family envelope stress response protein [Clostridia bacterium]|nr:Asp23/Gls24 family envelope stress response protein [Clostridia bacterium]